MNNRCEAGLCQRPITHSLGAESDGVTRCRYCSSMRTYYANASVRRKAELQEQQLERAFGQNMMAHRHEEDV